MDLILAQHSLDQLAPLHTKTSALNHAFIHEVSVKVSPQHAALFAEPKYIKDLVCWHTDGKIAVSLQSLPRVQQQEIIKIIQSILVDIACIARLHPKAEWSRNFVFYSCFPSLDYVYVVDGRPVLTGWGYAGINGFYDLLKNQTIQIKQQAQRLFWLRFPWITALSALFIGVLISLLWNITQHADNVCHLEKEMQSVLKEQEQNQALLNKRDDLQNSIQTYKKQCQLPVINPLLPLDVPQIVPLPQEPPIPALPPISEAEKLPNINNIQKQKLPTEPEKRADLPKDSWNKKDISMLNGCWHLTTPMNLQNLITNQPIPIQSWSVCFDKSGNGYQTITTKANKTCKGPVKAYFRGSEIIMTQPARCSGDFPVMQGTNVCRYENGREAQCVYTDNQHTVKPRQGLFKR